MARKRQQTKDVKTEALPAKRSQKSGSTAAKSKQNSQKQTQEPHDQEQSHFFRLPREIRDIIYHEIFTSPVNIHIAWVGGKVHRFRSFLCTVPEEDQVEKTCTGELCWRCKIDHHGCSPRTGDDRSSVSRRPSRVEQRGRRVMAMLSSCKRIYTETINMLYERNAFYIENPRTALELPKYMPQHRLSAFRDLMLQSPIYGDYTPQDRLKRWKEVVDALEKLDGLRALCVILQPLYGLTSEIEQLMAPLDQATLVVSPRIITTRVIKMTPVQPREGICSRHS
ncbi:hypothetical protein BJX99DRAFT_237944 [Aspergillus californicus]